MDGRENTNLVEPDNRTLNEIKQAMFAELATKSPESRLILNAREDSDSPTDTDHTGC